MLTNLKTNRVHPIWDKQNGLPQINFETCLICSITAYNFWTSVFELYKHQRILLIQKVGNFCFIRILYKKWKLNNLPWIREGSNPREGAVIKRRLVKGVSSRNNCILEAKCIWSNVNKHLKIYIPTDFHRIWKFYKYYMTKTSLYFELFLIRKKKKFGTPLEHITCKLL